MTVADNTGKLVLERRVLGFLFQEYVGPSH